MQIIYVETPRLYLAIDDGEIFRIERSKSRTINPRAVRVRAMDVSPSNKFGVEGNILHLDGWGLLALAGWLFRTQPSRHAKTAYRRLAALFDGGTGMYFDDTLKAVWRTVFGIPAYGESAHYVAQQWRQHPEGFAELSAAAQTECCSPPPQR